MPEKAHSAPSPKLFPKKLYVSIDYLTQLLLGVLYVESSWVWGQDGRIGQST